MRQTDFLLCKEFFDLTIFRESDTEVGYVKRCASIEFMEQLRLDKIRGIQVVEAVLGRTGNCRLVEIFVVAVPTYSAGSRKSL